MEVEFKDGELNNGSDYNIKKPKYVLFFNKLGIRSNKVIKIILIVIIIVSLIITIIIFNDISEPERIKYNISSEILETLPPDIQHEIRNANK